MEILEMKVAALAMDGIHNSPVVILKEIQGERMLPIWIGENEASAIALEMHSVKVERPQTHDLLRMVIESLNGKVQKVVVTELISNTFHAKIYIEQNGSIIAVDARPSDSIALALRTHAPIFVSENLLSVEMKMPEGEVFDEEDFKKYLKSMKPEDFGKYKI